MRLWKKPSNPVPDYRWQALVPAAPLALLMDRLLAAFSLLFRKDEVRGPDGVPANAIMYAFHGDIFCTGLTLDVIGRYFPGCTVLGNHSFMSYLWSGGCWLHGFPILRYARRGRAPIKDVLASRLQSEFPGRFFIRTDSGGPYGRVRKSLIELSLRTGRPLVAVRQRANRGIVIRSHQLPLPFSRILTTWSAPVSLDTIRALPEDDALRLLQARIDSLMG